MPILNALNRSHAHARESEVLNRNYYMEVLRCAMPPKMYARPAQFNIRS